MMHVTFQPANMTPYQLQDLFRQALIRFYSFDSIVRVLLTWGIVDALKRLGMAISIRLGACFLTKPERKYYSFIKDEVPPWCPDDIAVYDVVHGKPKSSVTRLKLKQKQV